MIYMGKKWLLDILKRGAKVIASLSGEAGERIFYRWREDMPLITAYFVFVIILNLFFRAYFKDKERQA